MTEAVKYRKNLNMSYEEKLINLKNDLINGPNHVFGYHTNCNNYFCKGQKDNEKNLVLEMKLG